MITFLSKIMKVDDLTDEKKRGVMGYICGGLGIGLNILLFLLKFFAGLISGSVSIMADAFNNLSDAGSSLVTIIGFKLAAAKPDRQHPYGHGRMEYIAALVVSCTILIMGFELMKESFNKIFNPENLDFSIAIVFILIISILVKCYMSFYNGRVGKSIDSAALKATAKDSLSDCIATFIVLACTLLNYFTGINADGFCGVFVSLFIFYAGYSAAKEAIDPLLGQAPDDEFIDHIEEIVTNFDENILGLHDLMVHDYGPGRRIISLHAEVPASGNILQLHDVIDNLEKKLSHDLGCTATIHMDPVVTDDPRVQELKAKVKELVKQIDDGARIHDFRVVWGDSHTNLIFDIALPFSCKYSNEEAKDMAQVLVKENIGENYFTVVDIDRENYILK